MGSKQETATIWVCQDCYVSHEYDAHESGITAETWTMLAEGERVTTGMALSEHGCADDDGLLPEECDCETVTFSTSSCEGCGSVLAGDRYAFTSWTEA